jgi:ribosomal protein S18 acetylase RimI-like enzyme
MVYVVDYDAQRPLVRPLVAAIGRDTEKHMLTLRSLRWPDDREALLALDTSFTTERVYRVVATAVAFAIHDTAITPPLYKVYDLTAEVDRFPNLDHVLIAEIDAQLAGVAALSYEAANRRAILWHLYVGPAYRRQGIGRALIDAMVARAQQYQARCLWLETQDVNYGAIQFYQRVGFQCCGLDLSLDDREGAATEETAVFFMRTLQ